MKKIEILDMTFYDFEQIQENLMTDFDDFWTPDLLKSELSAENRKYIVAKQKEKVIGFAGMIFCVPDAEIMNIVVKKSQRSKGIGNLLLDKLIEIAKKNDFENIILEVNETNKIAKKMYEKAGFEVNRNSKELLSFDRKCHFDVKKSK